MRTSSLKLASAFAALMVMAPLAVGAEDVPPYASATDAYRQGVAELKAGDSKEGLAGLAYAAEHHVLGAQLKLARLYAAGSVVSKDDAQAFAYYQQIADERADSNPRSPVAKYVAEAFVALGRYYQSGVPALSLAADPARAAGLYRHAASYFGDAEAQYALARLYLTGDGVDKNVGLAANWLAMAAKKQHPAAQAALGELLWREEVRGLPAKGLALIMLAHENAAADGKEPDWIAKLYAEAIGNADASTRKQARALIPDLGGAVATAAPAKDLVVPASGGDAKPAAPLPGKAAPADGAKAAAKPAGTMEMPVGFANSTDEIKR